VRGFLFAPLLGLLAVFCLGQDPVPPTPVPPTQAPPTQTPQNQAPQNQPGQDQPPQSPSSSQGQSSSKDQTLEDQPPKSDVPKETVPPIKAPEKQAPERQFPQNQSAITLDSSETIFAVLTALNACGYDQDLTISDATRSNVRAEMQRNLRESEEAEAARTALCDFAQNHVTSRDANRNLSQYISLALFMDGPPHFAPRVKEDDLPPDAVLITGFGSLLERFYEKVGLHSIWMHHRNDYSAAMRRYHEPLAKMVFDTEIYL